MQNQPSEPNPETVPAKDAKRRGSFHRGREATALATLSLLLSGFTGAQAQTVLSDPNQITGTIGWNNPPGPVRSYLDSVAPSHGLAAGTIFASQLGGGFTANTTVADDPGHLSVGYSITVQAGPAPGIQYYVWPVMATEDVHRYNFAALLTPTGVQPEPGSDVTLDFLECAGLIDLQFVDAADNPVTVEGGDFTAQLGHPTWEEQARATFGSASSVRLAVRGGNTFNVAAKFWQTSGSDFFSDYFSVTYTTNYTVTVGCDEIVVVKFLVPPSPIGGGGSAGLVGSIIGNVDMVGEDEHWFYRYNTKMTAQDGPQGNFRYGEVGLLTQPGHLPYPATSPVNGTSAYNSSGPFALANLLPSGFNAPALSVGYQVFGELTFGLNRRYEWFRTPWRDGSNGRVIVNPGTPTDLGDTFVIHPGYVQGDVFMCGPDEVDGVQSFLRHLFRDIDLGLNGPSTVSAFGLDQPAPGATHTAHGGRARALFEGDFMVAGPEKNHFVGDYRMALGGLNQEATRWDQLISFVFQNTATPTDQDNYLSFGVGIWNQQFKDVEIVPGQVVTHNHRYGFSRVVVHFQATSGALFRPAVTGDGSFNGLNFEGNPAQYAVGFQGSGTPTTSLADASGTGQVVLGLPEGDYTFRPTVYSVNPDGINISLNTLAPLEHVIVGPCEVVEVTPGLVLNVSTIPECVAQPQVAVSGAVTSTAEVASITYTLNGDTVTVCTGCGVSPTFNFTATLAACDNTLQITATDVAGRVSSRTRTVRFDDTPPVLTCAADKTVACGTAWTFDEPTASDACDGTAVSVVEVNTVTTGTCPQTSTRTWQATDGCGNTATCSQTVTVQDPSPPVITQCATDRTIALGTDCLATIPDLRGEVISTASCGPVTITQTPLLTQVGPGTYPVILTVCDGCANCTTCTLQVTVAGGSAPNLVINGSFENPDIGFTGNDFLLSVPGWTGNNSAGVLTTVELWRFTFGGMTAQSGAQHLEINAQISNETVSQVITGLDTDCLATLCFWHVGRFGVADNRFKVEITGSGLPPVTLDPPAYVNAGSWQPYCVSFVPTSPTVTIAFTGQSRSGYPGGAHIDNVSLTQCCATVVDPTPPVLTCVPDKPAECGTAWTFDEPTVTAGNCTVGSVTVTVVGTETTGTCPQVNTRTWQATDGCGNTATCSQTVTVSDNMPPVLTCAPDKTEVCGTAWSFDEPTAMDACSGSNVTITVVGTETTGTCPQTSTRTWQATDACGNSATCSQTVTVEAQPDADGDGVPDSSDNCPNSILSPTLMIAGCNTGVPNTGAVTNGCTIADLIAQCTVNPGDPCQFVSCVASLTDSLVAQGTITAAEQAAILSCAGRNQAPSFTFNTPPSDGTVTVTVKEDSGKYLLGFVTASPGPASEALQQLKFFVSNDNPSLFVNSTTAQPNITPMGELRFQPQFNRNGTATVTVYVGDKGGTACGGVNVSATQTFVITVTAVNDFPQLTPTPDPDANFEDAPEQTITLTGISPGAPADEAIQTVTITATSDMPTVVPHPTVTYTPGPPWPATATLKYTPVPDQWGTAKITVVVTDNGQSDGMNEFKSRTDPFIVKVLAVNDAPSFSLKAPPDVTLPEDTTGLQTIWGQAIGNPGPNETGQALIYAVSNNKPGLFTALGQPKIDQFGTLTFWLAPNMNGTATVSVQVSDTGGIANGGVNVSTAPPQSFLITVSPVNDAPTLTKVNKLTRASSGVPYTYTITYADLEAAANEVDVDGDPLSFVINSVSNGTLTKNGVQVLPGTTLIAGESLVWTYPANLPPGLKKAFQVQASDGIAPPTPAVQVWVQVQ